MTALVLHARRWLNGRDLWLLSASALAGAVGIGLSLSGALSRATDGFAGWPPLALALAATLATGAATGVGALPVLYARSVPERTQVAMLGFSAGIMLAASVFSLILPALDSGTMLFAGKLGGALLVAAGILLGGWLMLSLDRWVPHEHAARGAVSVVRPLPRVWLFVLAITLHNIPEGMAVGVGFAGGELADALPLAAGIGIQNMPEGLAVAFALLSLNYAPARAAAIALATGMVEPVGALLGAGLVTLAQPILPLAMAFAAGAMLFVVSHEVIPETHLRKGRETAATLGLLAGFIAMMLFDTMLG